MRKKRFLLVLSLLVAHSHYAMEPIQATAATQEELKCSICLEEIKEGEIEKIFSCKHSLHQECYSKLCARAKQENKKIVPCPTCRMPIYYMHIGFTEEERHQVTQFLQVEDCPAATIENVEIRQRVIAYREQLLDEDKIDELDVREWLLSHLELDAIHTEIPQIIKHCAALEAQVEKLLGRYADDQAKIKMLAIQNPTQAFTFLNTQFERKDAFIEKLQEENKSLHNKLCKKSKKYREKKDDLYVEWRKAELALSTLETMHAKATIQRGSNVLIRMSAFGYAAHKLARIIKPDSVWLDSAITLSTIGFMAYCDIKSAYIEWGQEKAVIKMLKGHD